MKYAGETLYIVVNNGEIIDVFVDEDEAQGAAGCINEGNVDDEVRDAGYDPEELTDDERAGFAFSAGYNSGYAYCETVYIPDVEDDCVGECEEDNEDIEIETEDSIYYTSHGDEFTYADIIRAYDDAITRENIKEANSED